MVIPGADTRHPAPLAAPAARPLPRGHLADVSPSADLQTAADLAHAPAPAIWNFLTTRLTLRMAIPGGSGAHDLPRAGLAMGNL
ncbi:hypothetical protein [Streptomyces sp. NPDC014744]|uniref:hypothetical protein n=1 Tax=Streptomyces sp. NPDC014744 TaxID=3364903 RepID=UPI0036F4BE65